LAISLSYITLATACGCRSLDHLSPEELAVHLQLERLKALKPWVVAAR
jgi:hypothetical protein